MKKIFEYILYLKYNGSMLSHWSGYLTYDVHEGCWVVNAGRYHVVTEYDIEVCSVADNGTVSSNFDDAYHLAGEMCKEIDRIPIDHELFI